MINGVEQPGERVRVFRRVERAGGADASGGEEVVEDEGVGEQGAPGRNLVWDGCPEWKAGRGEVEQGKRGWVFVLSSRLLDAKTRKSSRRRTWSMSMVPSVQQEVE